MRRSVVAGTLLVAASFAGTAVAEQPPLFMIRLRGPHTADDAQWAKTFKALTDNPGCCDEVWFSTGIGLPTLADHRTHVERLCRYAAQLRAKGIVPSLQVQATLGHSDTTTALEPVDGKDWGGFTGRGGTECRYCSCPRQPGFLAYVREMAKLYAAFKPGSVWIDDDLRIAGHAPGSPWERVKDGWVGCWCPMCLADFGRATGREWTRETLDAAVKGDPVLFRRWVEFSYSSIAEVARTIAAAVHEVSPETRLALQHGSGADADNLPVLKALHEATGLPVGSRPGGGLYYDDVPMNQMLKPMQSAKKIRALGNPDWIYTFCPEVETYPRAFGSRTAQGLFNESLMSLACGMNAISCLILDTRYEEDSWYSKALLAPLAAARTLLEDYRDFNADTVPAGLDVPDDVSANDALKLARLGIPLVTGVGRTCGAITQGDCDVKELGWTTSKMILDLRRQMDARTGGKCPVFVEDPTVGLVVPRVDKAGACDGQDARRPGGVLKSVVLFNCRIDRQEPVRLRLRGVPDEVRTGVWQAFRGQPTTVPLTRDGDEALVTIPAISAWDGGWLKLAVESVPADGTDGGLFDRRLGMFVHWGIYSVDGWHEQQQMRMHMSRDEYAKRVSGFGAERFDAEELVGAAESMGATYLVFTTKHHDGFCLWDTKTTDFNVMKSPCGRDLLREVSEACARRGMRLGIYYSNPDWHHPNAFNPKSSHQLDAPNPGDEPDIPKYVEYVKRQVAELCTNYGRLCCLFWDIPPKHDVPELNELVRRLQPGIEINDRGWGPGDYSTPERSVPEGSAFPGKTEACDSVDAESWGYRANADYHTVGYLTRSIDRTLAMGGNFLLNVGPRADGRLADEATALLRKVGAWHARVAESYRDVTTETNVVADARCIVTVRGKTMYLHYPRGLDRRGVDLSPVGTAPTAVTLLNTGAKLPFELVPMPRSYRGLRRCCLHVRGIPADELANEGVVIKVEFPEQEGQGK